MKKHLLAVIFLTAFCPAFSITYTVNMVYDDSARRFLVHIPTGFNTSEHLALVFNLHGYGSDDAQEEFYSRMSETADNNHFIVCYPYGLNHSWNSGFTPPYNGGVDDVGFISKIIDTLYTLYGIDLTRVYSCGMSNGGFQSYRLACDLENRIAAVASVTGAVTDLMALNCALSRKIPVLEIHGTADPLVPYIGSPGIKSVEETVSFWLSKDQCSSVNDTIRYPDIDPNDSSTVERIHYASCSSGTEVMFYKITGGGHTWPNAPIPFIYGPTNHDFDASQEIWDFFNRFTLNGPVDVKEVKREIELNVYPNPAGESFQLTSYGLYPNEELRAGLFDLMGRKVLEQVLISSATQINTAGLGEGIYFLKVEGQEFSACKRIIIE